MIVNDLNVKQQSFLFAQISDNVYNDPNVATQQFADFGFESEFVDIDGSQAYILTSPTDLVIACRGTQPLEWKDIEHDLEIDLVDHPAGGQCHRGFLKTSNAVWPAAVTAITRCGTRHIWFCGHSLGAAMASLVAMNCVYTRTQVANISVFAYGLPKMGDRAFRDVYDSMGIQTLSFINDNDVVVRLPPYPYRTIQSATVVYMNHWGNIRDLSPYQRAKDRIRGLFDGLSHFQIDPISDHLMPGYITNLARWSQGIEVPQTGL